MHCIAHYMAWLDQQDLCVAHNMHNLRSAVHALWKN